MTTATEDLLLAASDVQIEATAGKPSAVSIVAYTGGQMVVPGWGAVVIDLAGVDVSASQISILADHDSTLGGVVGFGRATVDRSQSRQGLPAGRLSPQEGAIVANRRCLGW